MEMSNVNSLSQAKLALEAAKVHGKADRAAGGGGGGVTAAGLVVLGVDLDLDVADAVQHGQRTARPLV